MTSLLEGPLARTIAKAFKGKLTTGTLRRVPASGLNADGDKIAGTPLTFTFNGIRDSLTAGARERAGIPQTDVDVLVLLESVVPRTAPKQDDQINIKSAWVRVVRIVEVDPAGATMLLHCSDIKDPT